MALVSSSLILPNDTVILGNMPIRVPLSLGYTKGSWDTILSASIISSRERRAESFAEELIARRGRVSTAAFGEKPSFTPLI